MMIGSDMKIVRMQDTTARWLGLTECPALTHAALLAGVDAVERNLAAELKKWKIVPVVVWTGMAMYIWPNKTEKQVQLC